MQVPTYASASNWLLEHGYLVALPLRRGYGETGGPWLENYGSCSTPDYYRAGLTTAEDIRTAADFLRDRSDVRRDRVLLLGVSAGGWGSLAAASQNPLAMLGVTDRGRLAEGQRADIVELDDALAVRRVWRAGVAAAAAG